MGSGSGILFWDIRRGDNNERSASNKYEGRPFLFTEKYGLPALLPPQVINITLQYICAILGELDFKDHVITLTASIHFKNLCGIYRVRDLDLQQNICDVGDAAICHDYDNSGQASDPDTNEWARDINNAIHARQLEETILYLDRKISKIELVKFSGQNAQWFLNLTKAAQANIEGSPLKFGWNKGVSYANIAREHAENEN